MARNARVARRSVTGVVVVGVLSVVLGVLSLVIPTPKVAAVPAPNGYYYTNSNWQFGPFASSDPSHTAYTGSNGALKYFNGLYIGTTVRPDERIGSEDELARTNITDLQVSVAGITGARAYIPTFGGADIRIDCETPDYAGSYCTVPNETYTITFSWTFEGYEAGCYYEWLYWRGPGGRPSLEDCPQRSVSDTVTRTVIAGNPNSTTTTTTPPQDPVAQFTAVASADDPYEYYFDNASTDYEDDPEDLTYLWEFLDGDTSTEENPTYRFKRAGTHTVKLTVTDTDGNTDETSEEVIVAAGLEVNSTADRPAEDPAEQGCDTGELVDDVPECTLRAAIETANELGGGEITFDIAGGGVPTIAVEGDLPKVTGPTTIDGTTQAGGWVQLTAGEYGLWLQAGPSKVTGLAIYDVQEAILLESGAGHEIVGNHLGTDVAGTVAKSTDAGVVMSEATQVTISDNVIGARIGVYGSPLSTGLTVEGNAVGVAADRVSPLGEQGAGILVGSPGTVVRDNVVRGDPVAIWVVGPAARGVLVEGNKVGVSGDGSTDTGRVRYGIRVDAAPEVKVIDNQVLASDAAAILVAGDKNYRFEGLSITLDPPSDDEPGTVTGGSATIRGNTIGIVGGAAASRNPDIGILTWGGAANSVIEGNTVAGTDDAAIEVRGGSGHKVRENTVGAVAPVDFGIRVNHAATTTVGGIGDARNEITSVQGGIEVLGEAPGLRLEYNTIRSSGEDATHAGIAVSIGAAEAVINANIVDGGKIGIRSEAAEAKITGNQITGQTEVGIRSTGDGSVVSGSSVTGGGDGIEVAGTDVEVTLNRVGLQDGSDTVAANTGTGVGVTGGEATLTRNAIAGGSAGIDVGGTATAELRANRIWQVASKPITVTNGPNAPDLTAAVRTTSGTSTRTTLVVRELPEEDAGTIEVFASDSCTDPEPRHLMDITRTKEAEDETQIIQIKGNATRDHFLVTYTDEEGRTSELSSCADAGAYPDGDGDGSPDPIDELFNLEDNPAGALVVTDDEELLMVATVPFDAETGEGGGNLEDVAVIDDPAPGSHPSGWSFPHGIIKFRITALEPGAATRVLMTLITDSSPIAGSSYWKYGPATPGAADSWYRFDFDEATGTGAVRVGAQNVPGLGIRDVFALSLRDGARGDHDGGSNGTITDPGGPVIGASEPEPPTSTTSSTPPSESTTTVQSGSASTTADPPAQNPAETANGELARTGSSVTGAVSLGLALFAAGIAVLIGRRRRRIRLGW